jgi:hypothetical protein
MSRVHNRQHQRVTEAAQIVMAHPDGITAREVAALMGISHRTASNYLQYAQTEGVKAMGRGEHAFWVPATYEPRPAPMPRVNSVWQLGQVWQQWAASQEAAHA